MRTFNTAILAIMASATLLTATPTFAVLPAVLIVSYLASVTDNSESAQKERAAFDAQRFAAKPDWMWRWLQRIKPRSF